MAQTAAQIREQIQKLLAKEQALKQREEEGVVERIKQAVVIPTRGDIKTNRGRG